MKTFSALLSPKNQNSKKNFLFFFKRCKQFFSIVIKCHILLIHAWGIILLPYLEKKGKLKKEKVHQKTEKKTSFSIERKNSDKITFFTSLQWRMGKRSFRVTINNKGIPVAARADNERNFVCFRSGISCFRNIVFSSHVSMTSSTMRATDN